MHVLVIIVSFDQLVISLNSFLVVAIVETGVGKSHESSHIVFVIVLSVAL